MTYRFHSPSLPLGFVPRRLLPREPEDQDVGPAVLVEVVCVGEEVRRVPLRVHRRALVVLVLLLEVRPLVPERPRREVELPVLVEVPVRRALAVEQVRQ